MHAQNCVTYLDSPLVTRSAEHAEAEWGQASAPCGHAVFGHLGWPKRGMYVSVLVADHSLAERDHSPLLPNYDL